MSNVSCSTLRAPLFGIGRLNFSDDRGWISSDVPACYVTGDTGTIVYLLLRTVDKEASAVKSKQSQAHRPSLPLHRSATRQSRHSRCTLPNDLPGKGFASNFPSQIRTVLERIKAHCVIPLCSFILFFIFYQSANLQMDV